jgi:hypothetical protein
MHTWLSIIVMETKLPTTVHIELAVTGVPRGWGVSGG